MKYKIVKEDGKYAIFDESGNRISEWFDWIYPDGLVEGKSDYYIACNGNAFSGNTCAVYHKNGKKVSEDFPEEYLGCAQITFNDNFGIVEVVSIFDTDLITTIDFNPVYPFKEEIIDYTKLLNI